MQQLVGAEAITPGEQHGALEHVGVAEGRPGVANGVGAGEDTDARRVQTRERRHGPVAGTVGHDGDAVLQEQVEELSELDLVHHAEAESVTHGDLAPEAEGARALGHEAKLQGAERPGIVEMNVHAHAVAPGNAEDDVEMPLGITVQSRGIDAADEVRAILDRALQELRGARPRDDAALGKGHDLDRERALQTVPGGHHAFEVAQADLRVDIGVVADVKGAAADGVTGQSLDLDVRPELELAAETALVFDPLGHGRPGLVGPPGQTPEGLVEVYVPVDECGEEDRVLAVDHRAALGGGDAGGEALDSPGGHQDVDGGSTHGPGVLDEEVVAHSGTLTVRLRQVKGRGGLSCVTFGVSWPGHATAR